MKKVNFDNAANCSEKSNNYRYTLEEVLNAKDWDNDHITAIKYHFESHQSFGDDPRIEASSIEDLISQVEQLNTKFICFEIGSACYDFIENVGVDPKSVAERVFDLLDEIQAEEIERSLTKLKKSVENLPDGDERALLRDVIDALDL